MDFTVSGEGYSSGMIFVIGENAATEKSGDITEELVFDFDNAKCGWFNYFAVKYKSDDYVKGTVTYIVKAEEHTEGILP